MPLSLFSNKTKTVDITIKSTDTAIVYNISSHDIILLSINSRKHLQRVLQDVELDYLEQI